MFLYCKLERKCESKVRFVDSDWCRVRNPFPFTEKTKQTVIENIQRMISDGIEENRIKRGINHTFHFYERYDYPTIDTTEPEIDQVADHIAGMVGIGKKLDIE